MTLFITLLFNILIYYTLLCITCQIGLAGVPLVPAYATILSIVAGVSKIHKWIYNHTPCELIISLNPPTSSLSQRDYDFRGLTSCFQGNQPFIQLKMSLRF